MIRARRSPPRPTSAPRAGPGGATAARPGLRALAVGAWVGALVGAAVLLHSLGTGLLSPPPVLDRAGLDRWLDERGPVVAAFALVRLVGLGLALYLLLVTILGLAARLSRVPALVAAVDVATVPAVRRVLGTMAGVTLTASAASMVVADVSPRAPIGPGRGGAVDAPVVMQRVPDRSEVILRRVPSAVGGGRATMRMEAEVPPGAPEREEGTATMRRDQPDQPDEPDQWDQPDQPDESDQPDEPDQEEAGPEPGTREWTVAPGDHLWSMAETTLARAWGREPAEAEVAPYWRAVVEANRAGLIDPANPDLIRPGQVLALPPPPPRPA